MNRIQTLDLGFMGQPEAIAAYLVNSSAGPILIETGPASTLPNLVKELNKHGVNPEDIKHVFVTHVHLDHAGAAWYFARNGANVYVHPKGLPHLRNPERLWSSAKRIYQDKMELLWGEMHPISGKLLISVPHKKRVKVGNLKIRALHTPGHASHHIAWEINDILFAGDVAGVKVLSGPVMPPCPPPDIDIQEWRNSIRLILDRRYKKLYLTHFGEVDEVKPHLVELRGRLQNWSNWLHPYFENGVSREEVLPKFVSYVDKQLAAAGVSNQDRKKYELANPSWMSVAGLYRYFKKHMTPISAE
ncbi:MAG: MBL fold metallo-hydrolase [Saprospiraceae bacterium]|nr:MBL fold metallo-hydrolase [Saprospiraceae bacterium]